MGWHDTEGYASLHPRLRATRFARAFDLQVVLPVKQVIINLSEAVWRFIGVGVADFVKLSVIICEICEELNHQRVIISTTEAVLRFRRCGRFC